MSERSQTDAGKPLGAGTRVFLAIAGGIAVVVGTGGAILAVVLWAGAARDGSHAGRSAGQHAIVALAVIALLGGFAGMGGTWLAAGMRGRAPASGFGARASQWMRRRSYAWVLVLLSALLAFAYAATPPDDVPLREGHSLVRLAWLLLLAQLLLPVHAALHELGHALAARLVGFRFRSMRVGALLVTSDAGRLRASWQPMEDAFGLHAAAPESAAGLGARLAIHAAGGPIASFAAAAACFAASGGVPRATTAGAIASDVLWVGGWVSLALGARSAVPFRPRSGRPNDGAALLSGLRRGGSAERAMLFFRAMWAAGRRPRSWGVDPSFFVGEAAQPGANRDALLLAGACVALDAGSRARAAEILRTALAAPAGDAPFRWELELQAAMLHAFDGDAAAARARLSGPAPSNDAPWYPLLAEAAVRLAEGRAAEASEALGAWERGVSGSASAASTRVGNDWAVEELRARLAR